VSFVDWAVAVHVLSAFAYVGGLVLFWVLVVAVRRVDTPEGTLRMEPIVKVGNVAVGLGAVGTIVVGIYLGFAVDSYAIWDGWIIAALVLWAVASALGQRTGVAYMQGMNKAKELDAAGRTGPDQELFALNRTQTGVILHALASLAVLLLLVDMIFKPGA
jgi:drug/metabolite transporter (DMT)-like permease